MKELKLINPENVSEEEIKKYSVRKSARAVVVDKENRIALLFVSKHNYYKIPGGGIEDLEDKFMALQRECLEELGCEIDVIGEIGFVIEYRKIFNIKQTSYCYLVKVKGEKGIPNFTDEEKSNGFEQVWLSYNEALKMVMESKTTDTEANLYIIPRDITFLTEAKSLIKNL